MKRIPMEALRDMWKKEGIYGNWRRVLKEGYKLGELYFELGLMPEKEKACDYRFILDHEVPVWLCPSGDGFRGEYVIRPDDSRAGEIVVFKSDKVKGFRYHTCYVAQETYNVMLMDAAHIFATYGDEETVCFWSIPNKWFDDLVLIQFVADKIVMTDDYKNRPRSRHTWYWP